MSPVMTGEGRWQSKSGAPRRAASAVGAASLAGVLMALGFLPAHAQSSLDLEFRGGTAVPAGDMAEISAPGGSVGLGAAWRFHDRLALRVDGDLEVLGENRAGGLPRGTVMPRTYLWHYHAGLELDVVNAPDSPWRLRLRGGGGGTTYDTELFEDGHDDFLDTYLSVSGGVAAGRQVSPSLEMGVVAQAFITFTDRDRTGELAAQSPVLNRFARASTLPYQIYVRWTR